jgi:hypothetical protein
MTHRAHLEVLAAGLGAALLVLTPTPARSDGPPRRLLYVADAHRIVGHGAAEEALLQRAAAWDVGELALYGLGPLLEPSEPSAQALAAFSQRARAAGIGLVAPVAGVDRVDALERFERAHPDARFTGWVTELEYWNRCAEARNGRRPCFRELRSLVERMSASADRRVDRPWIGVYLGYPTRAEARWIARSVDRVFLGYPGRSPVVATAPRRDILRSPDHRLARFAGARVAIWPIVYARGEAPMDPWLRERGPVSTAMRDAERELAQESPQARFAGFAWFDDAGLASLDP